MTWCRMPLNGSSDLAVRLFAACDGCGCGTIYSIYMYKPCLVFFRSTGDTVHDRTQHKRNTRFEVLVTVHACFFWIIRLSKCIQFQVSFVIVLVILELDSLPMKSWTSQSCFPWGNGKISFYAPGYFPSSKPSVPPIYATTSRRPKEALEVQQSDQIYGEGELIGRKKCQWF